jgi:hypothetical protein
MTMADLDKPSAEPSETSLGAHDRADDLRRPYEPPRLAKKRSVARATLFTTIMGPGTTGLTSIG